MKKESNCRGSHMSSNRWKETCSFKDGIVSMSVLDTMRAIESESVKTRAVIPLSLAVEKQFEMKESQL